jgi:hypothetical protein
MHLALDLFGKILMFFLGAVPSPLAISMAHLVPWPLIGGDGPSSSQQPVAQSSQSVGSSSISSSNEEGSDIRTMV